MSGFNTPQVAAQQPKQMSSRLLTMKFMQRASASSSNTLTKPGSSAEPLSKKRRIDTTSNPSSPHVNTAVSTEKPFSPASVTKTPQTSSRAQNYREGDETEWTLDYTSSTRNNQTSPDNSEDTSDQSEEEIWSNQATGRQIYGNFKRRKINPTGQTDGANNDEELSSLDDSDDESNSDSDSSSRPQSRSDLSSPQTSKSNNTRNQQARTNKGVKQKQPDQPRQKAQSRSSLPGQKGGQPGSLRELANRADARQANNTRSKAGGHAHGNGQTKNKNKESRKTI